MALGPQLNKLGKWRVRIQRGGVRRWQAKAGGGAGGEKLPRGPILASRAATLLLQRPEERPAGWAAEPESGTVWSPLELRSRCSAS